MANIAANMEVRYIAAPSVVGFVVSVEGDNARVFIDGSRRLVPVRELEPAVASIGMSPSEFRVALTHHRLEHPVSDQLLSYRASKTKLLYHQFLPVKKLLESPDQRLLIADEVGAGKTIEAGIIWAELESRSGSGLENVWIVCPKSLVGKWQDEMLQRFDFRLEALTPGSLRQALATLDRDGALPPRFSKVVINLELLRMENNVERLADSSISWDLAIFDEAHHLRNTDTLSYALADFVCDRSKAAVFLTATPLQTHLGDIVHLMQALGVDVAEDPDLLKEQLDWDMEMNDWIRLVRRQPPAWKPAADSLLRLLATIGGRGRPGWDDFAQLTAQSDLSDRRQRTVVIDAARDLQALSPYMTRTLRADMDENRPTREPITRTVEFSSDESAFYNEVYRICLERAAERNIPPGFVTQMPERRTASCVPSVASEILRLADEDEEEENAARFRSDEANALAPLARAALNSPDRKLEALFEILDHAFTELGADRAMIFSTFQGTLHYLRDKMRERGYSHELMYGPTPPRDEDCRRGQKSRERISSEFRRGEFQVLLASEVAGEGLDFEHCNVLINYDLPWNPMRVEQRIGRCDRIGQQSDKIYVGNLASVGTIEERILSRLYERLNIFERALGDLESILGEQIATFERDLFRSDLSPQQQNERLERIAQTIENNARTRDSIAQSSVISDVGRQLIDSDQQEFQEAEARYLSPEELAEFVHGAIERHFAGNMTPAKTAGEFDVAGGDLLRAALNNLLGAYPATYYARDEIVRFRNRISEQGRTQVSFVEDRDGAEFVHARHPLMLLARHLERDQLTSAPRCSATVPSHLVDTPTMLVWAIGSLEGYTSRAELLCAAVDCVTGKVIPIPIERGQEYLRAMTDAADDLSSKFDVDALTMSAEQAMLTEFESVKSAFDSRESILTDKARRAVRSHAESRIARNDRQLSREDLDPRLRTMFNGWNRRLEGETQAKLAEIDRRSGTRTSLEIIGVAVVHPG